MAARGGTLLGYRGHVDAIEPVVSGWIAEIARPAAPVHCFLSLDRKHRTPFVADRPRPDVAAAGLADSNCGFAVGLPPDLLDGREHVFDLQLPDGRRLNLPGAPSRIALGPVPIDLVPAGAASLDAVLDLLRRNDREAGFDPALIGREHAAAFNSARWPDDGAVFYARAGRRLVGYGRLDRGQNDAVRFAVVALSVLVAYRRKGLGEALLRALLDAAEADGLRQVWLSVRPDNAPALRLYEKLGFVHDASCPPGRWLVPGEATMVWMAT
jgi:GNAT superfamily N-acetyltransferase